MNAIEEAFGTELSNEFHIHRTRQNFPNNGIDTFENMAENGLKIVDSVVLNEMNGTINQNRNYWIIHLIVTTIKQFRLYLILYYLFHHLFYLHKQIIIMD